MEGDTLLTFECILGVNVDIGLVVCCLHPLDEAHFYCSPRNALVVHHG